MTSRPILNQLDPGTYFVMVEIENQFGCTFIDSVEVGVLDTVPDLSAFSFSQCSGNRVNFMNNNAFGPNFAWDFGDPSQPGLTSEEFEPSHVYPGPGDYIVQLYYNTLIPCGLSLIHISEPTRPY